MIHQSEGDPDKHVKKLWVTAPFIFWLGVSVWVPIPFLPFLHPPIPLLDENFFFMQQLSSGVCIVLASLYLLERDMPKKHLAVIAIVLSLLYIAFCWYMFEGELPQDIVEYWDSIQSGKIRLDKNGNVIQP